jgi:hypothetical protein|tara:strand:+ start:386 stop:697 length:312 start_codon:yes stop_codon:yes gene_type:complete
MILHDFRCEECGTVEEHMCSADDIMSVCDTCGAVSHRVFKQLAKPHWLALAQGASASPEAIDRFERMHKQQKAKEDKTYAEHGDYGNAPGASGRSQHYNDQSL